MALPAMAEAAAAAAAAAHAAGERRPSLSLAALANLKGASAALVAGSGGGGSGTPPRRASRMSVMVPGSSGGAEAGGGLNLRSRRGSNLAAVLASTAALAAAEDAAERGGEEADALGALPLHPGLDRIKSFNRKKSVFRSAGSAPTGAAAARAVHFDTLVTAMDTLDERIGGALQQMRSQNAAGLGTVRGLVPTRSGRLRLNSRDVSATTDAAEVGGELDWQQPADAAGDGDKGDEGADGFYSPHRLLGAQVAERPEKFLQRMKFDINDQQVGGQDWAGLGKQSADCRLGAQYSSARPPALPGCVMLPACCCTGAPE